MNIRIMNSNDYDKVYSLWLNTSGMGLNDIDDSRVGIERYLNKNPGTCFVACKNEEIVGVILSGHDGRRGYIYHMAVETSHRKSGIGRMLVDSAIDSLKSLGIIKVAFVVFKNNISGNEFWNKIGFDERPDLIYRNKKT